MNWTPELRDFIQEHLNDDTAALLLAARRYQGIDVPFAVEQIEARKRLKGKLPEWYENAELVMGGKVPAEQCSSEVTARYKRSIIEGESLCDMTGGMGVDFWYMSDGMKQAIYTERNETLCEIAKHNFQMLKDGKHPEVEVKCGDGRDLPIPLVDIIYLDPARRAGDGSRVYAMEDCEPNIVAWQDELLQKAKMLLVKLSPMVDLTDVLRKLKGVSDVYIVGVRNECKEVLVKQAHALGDSLHAGCVKVHCVDFLTDKKIEDSYNLTDKNEITVVSDGVGNYLYEPDVTLMKAQAFGSLCQRFPVYQLDVETHLMTSDEFIADFPGRIFEVEDLIPFSSKVLKRLKKEIPQANIATRNFVMTAEELQKRSGIKDGGEVYLFGAKVKDMGQILLKCRKKVVTSHP
jgi:16S rRNA G966 N2-methylase RsmD